MLRNVDPGTRGPGSFRVPLRDTALIRRSTALTTASVPAPAEPDRPKPHGLSMTELPSERQEPPGAGGRPRSPEDPEADRRSNDAASSESSAGGLLPHPWGVHRLPDDSTLALRLGARDLWLRRRKSEIQISERDRGRDSGDLGTWGYGSSPREPEPDAEWSRWATPGTEREVALRPILPDRPVVLEPEWPFRLLPGAEARVYVRVPLWIRIELLMDDEAASDAGMGTTDAPAHRPLPAGGRGLKLVDLPAIQMSDTWWGEFYQGELAYWLPTTARRAMSRSLFAPHLAVCPLLMRNRADYDLQVERLALRVEHLSLFVHDGQIWSDESRVLYQGGEEGSQIEMTGRPPEEAPGGVLVTGPRTPLQRGLRARTFDRLRALPGFGGWA